MFLFAIFVISFIAVALLSNFRVDDPPPEEVERPVTEEGKILGPVLGTAIVSEAQVLRWGEVEEVEIRIDNGK